MSLNWKEINLILEELDLEGAQIQGAVQSAFDVIVFRIHKKGETKNLLVSLSSGACRINETFGNVPKPEKPLRFAQFLNSRIVNGWITKAVQLEDNRIVHICVRRGEITYNLYLRLWSNAANFIVTDIDDIVLDAMRRLPKRGEVTGAVFSPPVSSNSETKKMREYFVRDLPGEGSFNKKIDEYYAAQAGPLSLETLRPSPRDS